MRFRRGFADPITSSVISPRQMVTPWIMVSSRAYRTVVVNMVTCPRMDGSTKLLQVSQGWVELEVSVGLLEVGLWNAKCGG